jgi:phosphonoacetaldehyde hydrolase
MLSRFPKIRLCIFDLGGTLIDKQCQAPVIAMQRLFAKRGFDIHEHDIRTSMGLPKIQHLSQIMKLSYVDQQFHDLNRRKFDDCRDLNEMFLAYQIEQLAVLKTNDESTQLVDGARRIIEYLREKKIQIALTTGYNRLMMNVIKQSLSRQGFIADFDVSSSEANSRKEMNMKCCDQFCILKKEHAIAVGDTINDLRGAQLANVNFVGIENEWCSKERFDHLGANTSISNIFELVDII